LAADSRTSVVPGDLEAPPVELPSSTLSWSAAMGLSFLAALGRPAWWLLAMASFLLRGGFVVLVVPIVTLPTAAGLSNLAAPAVVGVVFGGPVTMGGLILGALFAIVVWIIGGGFVAAAIDVALLEDTARDEDLDEPLPARPRLALRVTAARLLAHVPTAVVGTWAASRLVVAAYEELSAPGEAAVPLILRIADRAPEAVLLLVAALLVGEAAGGLAARGIAAGSPVLPALGRAWQGLATRPSAVATLAATNALLGMVVVGVATAAGMAWQALRLMIIDAGSSLEVGLALVLFSTVWLVGAWLVAIAVAWRQAAWTFEALRRRQPTNPDRGLVNRP
jgi:hypothetical protein